MSRFYIQESREGFRPYGGAARAFNSKSQEVMLSGAAETGKTFSLLHKIHALALLHAGSQLAIVRRTHKSAVASVLQTMWDKVIKGDGSGIFRYGKERPERFIYPNGSVIWCGGMDNPDKVLSSERDLIYVNQAEELTLDQWEILLTRCTGRAGNMPWAQLLGDCNPSSPYHWIKHRESLKFFESFHRENPTLYDQITGQITEQGQRTMAALETLTGVRRDRLLLGKWVQAEGLVYENWTEEHNLIDETECPMGFKKITASIDWGYTEPWVLGIWGHDNDGRMYLIKQIFKTKRTSSWWTRKVVESNVWTYGRYGLWIGDIPCDPSRPEYIADLRKASTDKQLISEFGSRACRLNAVKAPNAILPGIDRVSDRIKIQGDGLPRLFVIRDSLEEIDQGLRYGKKPYSTEQEILEYVWKEDSKKEEPVDKDDHGCFVAGTMIRTIRGDKPIEQIRPGDMVLTRKGYKTVEITGLTNRSAKIYKIKMSNGQILIGTGDHPIFLRTGNSIPLHDLHHGDIVCGVMDVLEQDPVPISVVNVSERGCAPVYNIQVRDQHEYFANGFLVSNCDMMRYAISYEDGIDVESWEDPASVLVDVSEEVYGHDLDERDTLLFPRDRRGIFRGR